MTHRGAGLTGAGVAGMLATMKSTNGPRYHFSKLAQQDYIMSAGGRARTMRVTEAGRAVAGQ